MLEKLPFPDEVIRLFKAHGKILHYEKNCILQDCCVFNNSVCILLAGIVKISIIHHDKRILLYHINGDNPQIINYTSAPQINSNDLYTKTLEKTTVISIPNELFLDWTSTYIELRDFMITSFQYHYISIVNKMYEISNSSLESNLLSYIKTKSKLYKKNEVKIPLLEMSEDLNFSREAISRGLKVLENNNLIIRKTRSIILL